MNPSDELRKRAKEMIPKFSNHNLCHCSKCLDVIEHSLRQVARECIDVAEKEKFADYKGPKDFREVTIKHEREMWLHNALMNSLIRKIRQKFGLGEK